MRGNVELSLPIFRLALAVFTLGEGCRIRPARAMAPALMLCWIEGGAGFFLFSVLAAGVVELPGRSRPAPGVSTFGGAGLDLACAACIQHHKVYAENVCGRLHLSCFGRGKTRVGRVDKESDRPFCRLELMQQFEAQCGRCG